MPLPKDPFLLLSIINMKLRDLYSCLDALCDDMDEDKNEIIAALEKVGYRYNAERNAFTK